MRTRFFAYVKELLRTRYVHGHERARNFSSPVHESQLKYPTNPLIGYLNINSLRNKISDLWKAIKIMKPDYFVVGDTKLDVSFPSAQFIVRDYEIRNCRDRYN